MHTKKERLFIHLSGALAIVHALGYIWLGINEGFTVPVITMVVLDLLYIPVTTIKSVKLFPSYLVAFSVALVFITSAITSELFNNYSALLCLFVAILIKPKLKYVFMSVYLLACSVAFCLANDYAYYLIIHFSRSLWIFVIYDFIIYVRYESKPVILFDEDIELLEQLTNGSQIKSLELNGMSERTIRRRLDSAKKRNGLKTTDELKELYKKTYKK